MTTVCRLRFSLLALFLVAGCEPGTLGGDDPDSGLSLADAGLDGPGDPPADASPIAPLREPEQRLGHDAGDLFLQWPW